jgi:hypothetical protein
MLTSPFISVIEYFKSCNICFGEKDKSSFLLRGRMEGEDENDALERRRAQNRLAQRRFRRE